MTVHANSEAAMAHIRADGTLRRRKRDIVLWLAQHGPATDRQVQAGLGYAERGNVQPTISFLVDEGWLEEVDSVECEKTGYMVRRTAVAHLKLRP